MDGFKNSTKTQYTSGGSCYAKGGSVKGAAKISKVMGEFKSGALHSGSKTGPEVTSKKQATAIALSEARKAGAKIPVKRGGGGSVEAGDVLISRMNKEELKQGPRGIKHAEQRVSREETKPVRRGVPVAPKAPLISRRGGVEAGDVAAARMAPRVNPRADADLRARQARAAALGLKKGGLAAMPKGKGCK